MRAYKFKIRNPSRKIVQKFEFTLDICRELYNAALQERRDAYRQARSHINYYDQSRQLKEIRCIREDFACVHAQISQDVLRRVDKTFKSFFSRLRKSGKFGYPRFKSRLRFNSFTYPQHGFRLIDNKLTLSKIGSCRIHLSREMMGKVKTCTIKKQVDGWFVIFVVEETSSPYFPKTRNSAGIDLGVENFVTLSTGEVIENPKFFHRVERDLKIQQRKVSKKKLHGSNWKKAVILLSKKHLKVHNQRRDFFHKLSLQLIKEFDEIAVENLNIAGMVRNHHLAKSISDVSWGTFLQILTFKAESAGRKVWKVPSQYTSQDCSKCGNRVRKSLSEREHSCLNCGYVTHRDHNAAQNILARTAPVARLNEVI